MTEEEAVLQALGEIRVAGKKAVLATVVQVKGSAYRREGAKMLVDEEGRVTGIISGGCLEPDIAEIAKRVMESEEPVYRRYELDEETVFGLGLGCPGTVDVYIEPVLWKERG